VNRARAIELGRRIGLALGLPALLLAVWWIASSGSANFFFPPLRVIVEMFGDVWISPRIVDDVMPSLARLLTGYFAAVALGLLIGVPIGASRTLRNFLEPVLEFLRAIPTPALVPILILFASIGDTMKTLVIASGCIWPVLLNTVEGVRGRDEVLEDVVRSYRIHGLARLWHFVIPSASPQMFTGMRQALSIGIILMVISEMFAASNGLGFAIIQFERSFAVPEMWTGIIMLGLIGVLLSFAFRLVENRVLAWYHGLRQSQRAGG
jgi:ABC-type nitrate/sulfonate/bicarbonate transport system permease component